MRWVLLGVAALCLAGCGGSSGSADPPTPHYGATFDLPSGFKPVATHAQYAGTGLLGGSRSVVTAGVWEKGKDKITLTIEPITRDTKLDALYARCSTNGELTHRLDEKTRLAGHAAVLTTGLRGHPSALISTRKGFAYTLEVSDRKLLAPITASWGWRSFSNAESTRLNRLLNWRGDGYRLQLPRGWQTVTGDELSRRSGVTGFEATFAGRAEGCGNATNFNISREYVDPETLASAARAYLTALPPGDRPQRLPNTKINGEPAAAFVAVRNLVGLRVSQAVFLVHHGTYTYTIAAGTTESLASAQKAAKAILSTWRWG